MLYGSLFHFDLLVNLLQYVSLIAGDHSPGKLGKVRDSKVVREKSGKMEEVRGSEIGCVFSSYKYSKTSLSAGAPLRTPAGELMTLPPDP